MKLKTYLRGLGLGIIVTTLIMSISLGGKQEMSDAEVIARAKELGMVEGTERESGPLLDRESIEGTEEESEEVMETMSEETSETTTVESETVSTQAQPEESEESVTEETVPGETKETETKETVEKEETVENPDDLVSGGEEEDVISGQLVSIAIESGDDSAVVSRRLEEVGLVISATSYDKFLCDNGYARKLSPGTYEIAIGSSEETIAKIITKSR